jgi:hypothetical protein
VRHDCLQSWLGSALRHSSFDKILSMGLHFSQTYAIMNISLMISMEKTMKKLTKTKKIILAVVAAVLCIATVLLVVLIGTSQNTLEKFAGKIARKQNFQMDVVISGIPLFGSIALTYEIDGNIQHIPENSFTEESYVEIVGDKQYHYSKDENGKWIKAEAENDSVSIFQDNEIFQQLINFNNYELVEGTKNVYRQKADVVFDGCKDVTITLERNSCTIQMISLSDGMDLETVIMISNVGGIHLTLPRVA